MAVHVHKVDIALGARPFQLALIFLIIFERDLEQV